MLHADRFFSSDSGVRGLARELYAKVAGLPLVCPHGHVDPRLLAKNEPFPDPTELIVIPDHYVFRMLYSQGISLESLGVPRSDGGPVEEDRRKIWQVFGDSFYLFRGTPTACWMKQEFDDVFGIDETLNGKNAMAIYDRISEQLKKPEFLPRALFERFNIEVLCTTDAATDTLEHHRAIAESGWSGKVRPTFRPDGVINILHPAWRDQIGRLAEMTDVTIASYDNYISAIEARRQFFKSMGATATDHAVLNPRTERLSPADADGVFQRALKGNATAADAEAFTAHMVMEMARMSCEDGLVMQLHPGSFRDHNQAVHQRFGPDKGCDIPISVDFTRNLLPLLNEYGNDSNFTLVLFTLDESTYSRELAPLAGHYPCLRLGPPWWFHDSIEGMRRFRQRVTETAGIYNTAGFNDDTRAFPSIPARHDLCRRVDANFLAGLVCEHVIDEAEAQEMIVDLSYNLVRKTYRLGS
jgi:glucuronate isomerase